MATATESVGSGKGKSWLRRRWWQILLLVLLGLVSAFVAWAAAASGPMPEALAALQSDGSVVVTTQPWYTFEPVGRKATTGLVIYPGAKVEPRSYAPAARRLAAAGYLVTIVPVLLNLAILSPDKAGEVIAAHSEVKNWAVAGHSLGGAMAAQYAYSHPTQVEGLVLWAAYPPDGADMSKRTDLSVVSIYGTRDGLATPDKIDASRKLLPASTQWVPIEGGNHAQFGWYGPQGGDLDATVSREEQQTQIVSVTESLLALLK